jgi:hypothetical protein
MLEVAFGIPTFGKLLKFTDFFGISILHLTCSAVLQVTAFVESPW